MFNLGPDCFWKKLKDNDSEIGVHSRVGTNV